MLIEAIGTVAVLLIEWKRHKTDRAEQFFDRIAHPIFEQMHEVHAEYRRMFLDVLRANDDADTKDILGARDEVNTAAKVALANAQRRKLLDARKENAGFRDELRQDAAEYLLVAPNTEAKRFMYSIIRYFLDDYLWDGFDEQRYDMRIEKIIRVGGIRETPATRLTRELSTTSEPSRIREIVSQALVTCDQRFSDVAMTYRAMKIAVHR